MYIYIYRERERSERDIEREIIEREREIDRQTPERRGLRNPVGGLHCVVGVPRGLNKKECVYMYIYRERDTHVCIYIYIYREREIQIDRWIDR